jgi:hypothetical protein
MMSLEAKNGGAFWGAAFRKFSTLRTDYLRVPAKRFLNFWNHPVPINWHTFPGEQGSSRVFEPLDSAGALSSRERKTGTERQRGFVLPLCRYPKISFLSSDKVGGIAHTIPPCPDVTSERAAERLSAVHDRMAHTRLCGSVGWHWLCQCGEGLRALAKPVPPRSFDATRR